MKAYLLAAGRGIRLRPLTDRVPKCLVEVGGRPMLDRWLDALATAGVTEVLINTHHLADQVEAHVSRRASRCPAVRLEYEERLLGSAGTVARHRDFAAGAEAVWVVYVDNVTGVNLETMRAFHGERQSRLTIGLFHSPEPSSCGIASLDEQQRVVAFEEKPDCPPSDLANAGIYLMDPGLIARFPARRPLDFGYDILPLMVGEMYGYAIDRYFFDLGTPERLAAARAFVGRQQDKSAC